MTWRYVHPQAETIRAAMDRAQAASGGGHSFGHSGLKPDTTASGPTRKLLTSGGILVGASGFEPPTSWSRTRRSSQAEPRPESPSVTRLLPLQLLPRKLPYFRHGFALETPVLALVSRSKLHFGTAFPRSDFAKSHARAAGRTARMSFTNKAFIEFQKRVTAPTARPGALGRLLPVRSIFLVR